jgi:hypothetical protein
MLLRMLFPHPATMRRIHGKHSAAGLAGLYLLRPFRLMRRAIRDLSQAEQEELNRATSL